MIHLGVSGAVVTPECPEQGTEQDGWSGEGQSPRTATSFSADPHLWCFSERSPIPAVEALKAKPQGDGRRNPLHAQVGLGWEGGGE